MVFRFLFLVLIILSSLIIPSSSITVFECAHSSSGIVAYATNKIQPCLRRPPSFNSTMKMIQLFRKNIHVDLSYVGCYLNVKSVIFHCGMRSHSSIMDVVERDIPISPNVCKNLALYGGTINLYGKEFGPFVTNTVTSKVTVLHGSVNQQTGNCDGETFEWDNRIRTNAVSFDTFTFGIFAGKAIWNMETDSFVVPGQVECKRNAQRCRSESHGDIHVLNDYSRNCRKDDVKELYRGPASIVNSTNGGKYILVSTKTRTFALNWKEDLTLCDKIMGFTGIKDVFIHEISPNGHDMMDVDSKYDSEDIDFTAEILSKILLLDKSIYQTLERQVSEVELQMCELRRREYESMMSMAYLAPEEFAYMISGGPGFQAVRRGEIVYLVKCVPQEVAIWDEPARCFDEIPVNVSNKMMFAKPKSRILTDMGTEVECDNIMPVGYLVADKWYSSGRHRLEKPLILDPNQYLNLTFESILQTGTTGMYTDAEISKMRNKLMFEDKIEVVSNIMTRQMLGLSVDYQGYELFEHIPLHDIENIGTGIFTNTFKIFYLVGWWTSFIIGINMIWKIIWSTYYIMSNMTILKKKDIARSYFARFRTALSNRATTLALVENPPVPRNVRLIQEDEV